MKLLTLVPDFYRNLTWNFAGDSILLRHLFGFQVVLKEKEPHLLYNGRCPLSILWSVCVCVHSSCCWTQVRDVKATSRTATLMMLFISLYQHVVFSLSLFLSLFFVLLMSRRARTPCTTTLSAPTQIFLVAGSRLFCFITLNPQIFQLSLAKNLVLFQFVTFVYRTINSVASSTSNRYRNCAKNSAIIPCGTYRLSSKWKRMELWPTSATAPFLQVSAVHPIRHGMRLVRVLMMKRWLTLTLAHQQSARKSN